MRESNGHTEVIYSIFKSTERSNEESTRSLPAPEYNREPLSEPTL